MENDKPNANTDPSVSENRDPEIPAQDSAENAGVPDDAQPGPAGDPLHASAETGPAGVLQALLTSRKKAKKLGWSKKWLVILDRSHRIRRRRRGHHQSLPGLADHRGRFIHA